MKTADAIREASRKLLADKKVDLILGYERGSLPLRATPCFTRDSEDTKRLIWDSTCDNNLSVYLRDKKEKVGIVAKSCDIRSIVVALQEKQIPRNQIVLLSARCQGVIDRKKIEEALGGKEVLAADVSKEEVTVEGKDFRRVLNKDEFLCDSCLSCRHRDPPISDVLVEDEAPSSDRVQGIDEFAEVERLEEKPADERWAYFAEEFRDCIRCYACRDACPLCYCKECIVDQTMPMWVGKTTDLSDTVVFHLVRALHVAGRCVDCGACSRACPMGIDIRALNKKVEKDVRELFGHDAGLSVEAIPPLATFRRDDREDFIMRSR